MLALLCCTSATEWAVSLATAGLAVLYLEAVLGLLRCAAATEWAVALWVVRTSSSPATKHLKSHWEAEQLQNVEHWMVCCMG